MRVERLPVIEQKLAVVIELPDFTARRPDAKVITGMQRGELRRELAVPEEAQVLDRRPRPADLEDRVRALELASGIGRLRIYRPGLGSIRCSTSSRRTKK